MKQLAGMSRQKSTVPRVKLMYSAARKSAPATGGVKYCKIQALLEINKFQKSAESHLENIKFDDLAKEAVRGLEENIKKVVADAISALEKIFSQKLPLMRYLEEVLIDIHADTIFTDEAVSALEEASETYMTEIYKDAQLCANHGQRHIITTKDVQLARRIRGERI